jgi:hypothetical protein
MTTSRPTNAARSRLAARRSARAVRSAAALALLAILATGCEERTPGVRYAGTWAHNGEDVNRNANLRINADGTFNYRYNWDRTHNTTTVAGEWDMKGGSLRLFRMRNGKREFFPFMHLREADAGALESFTPQGDVGPGLTFRRR